MATVIPVTPFSEQYIYSLPIAYTLKCCTLFRNKDTFYTLVDSSKEFQKGEPQNRFIPHPS